DAPWLRWTRSGEEIHAVTDQRGRIRLPDPDGVVDEATARIGESPVSAMRVDGAILVETEDAATPIAISFRPRV
ncbi:hypothetical protein, partial [Burkholderia sp. SIMBA_024]